MKTANIILNMDRIGASVVKKGVTPPELMFLVAMHHSNVGGDPVMKLEENEEEIEFSAIQEKRRLIGIYGAVRINKFYPGNIPQMPATFAEAREAGVQSGRPSESMLVGEHDEKGVIS